MADNINFNPITKRHSFVSVKERPWHGLGTIVEEKMTASECIQLAGLDYKVIKAPMYVDTDYARVISSDISGIADVPDSAYLSGERLNARLKLSPKAFSTIRTDTKQVLGVVGADYTVIDNKEAFDFFDTIVGTQSAIYETAGALGRGEVTFITAKIPSVIKLGTSDRGQADDLERYIVLSNSHDGSSSLEAFITTIRVVCNNTLAAARNSATCRFKIRHTKNAKDRIGKARDILNLETEIIEAFAMNAQRMIVTNVTDSIATELIANSFFSRDDKAAVEAIGASGQESVRLGDIVSSRKLNTINDVFNHYKNGPGSNLATANGTAWGVYNAVSSYYQNGKTYKSDTDRMKSLLYGDAYNKITKAYNVTADFALADG